MWQFFLFTFLILAPTTEANIHVTKSKYVVCVAQVVHRHGARSPIPKFNQDLICGPEYPCGYLNNIGISMLAAVGAYVRDRYNNPSIVEEPFFPLEKYNASLIYSRSTAKERTIQSCSAFLSGVFPESSLSVPYTVELSRDTLLNPDVYPSVISRYLDTKVIKKMLNPIVDSYFSWEELRIIAAEASASESCLDYDKRYDCVLQLFDIVAAYKEVGKLGDKKRLERSLEGTRAVNRMFSFYLFNYNPQIETDRVQGTVAHKLIEQVLENMYSYLSSPSYRMYEYSTHDSMLTPLGITLGDYSNETFNVPFAQTYILELLKDVETKTFHVRVLRGFPERSKVDQINGFSFTETSIQWYCMRSNNSLYEPINNICPLEDFARFINSTRAAEEDGFCFIQEDLYKKLKCPISVDENVRLSRHCRQYRIVCPKRACGKGFVLSASDLQCYGVAR